MRWTEIVRKVFWGNCPGSEDLNQRHFSNPGGRGAGEIRLDSRMGDFGQKIL